MRVSPSRGPFRRDRRERSKRALPPVAAEHGSLHRLLTHSPGKRQQQPALAPLPTSQAVAVRPYNTVLDSASTRARCLMDNSTIAHELLRQARNLATGGENLYRVRAYRQAAVTIQGLDR